MTFAEILEMGFVCTSLSVDRSNKPGEDSVDTEIEFEAVFSDFDVSITGFITLESNGVFSFCVKGNEFAISIQSKDTTNRQWLIFDITRIKPKEAAIWLCQNTIQEMPF